MSGNTQISLLPKQDEIVPMAKNEVQGIAGTMAINSEKISLRNTIKAAILKAHFLNARSIEPEDLTFQIEEVMAEILRAYSSIRVSEIYLAIHKGAMGEFGKIYSLSVAFFIECIRTYINSEARINAVKKYLQQNEQKKLEAPKTSPEDKLKQDKQIISNAYASFKANGYYNDYGNYILHLLSGFGVIKFTEEDRIDIWNKARNNVFNYYTRTATSIDMRNENRKIVSELRNNKDHEFFYTEAKKIALNKFFSDLKEMETEITDLIEA